MKSKSNGKNRIADILFAVTGILFFFCWKTESLLAREGNIIWTMKYTFSVLLFSLFVGGISGIVLGMLLYGVGGRLAKKEPLQVFRKPLKLSGGRLFVASLAGMLLVWLPTYLAYYPAICAYDSPVQTGQVVGGYFIDHHPIAHTLLIKWFMELGNVLFHNVNTGIGIYSAVQMLFLAAAFSYGIVRLQKHGAARGWLAVLQLYFMAFPFHWYMSVSMTKDTVFTAFFVLEIISLYEIVLYGAGKGMYALFAVTSIGMILFRNNGKYAFLVLLGILVLPLLFGKSRASNRKKYGRLFLWAAAAFVLGNLALTGIFRVTHAEQGDKREMLSLPIQQLARCMIYHGGVGVLPEDDGTMDAVDRALIDDFILYQGYQYYDASLADPVKGCTNTYIVRYRTLDFAKTYFHLLGQYPGDFINAFLAVNAGYLYPKDETHAFVNMEEGQTGMSYVQTHWEEGDLNPRGLYKDTKWAWLHENLEQWAEENAYLKLPVLRYLFMPGIWLWLYLVMFGVLLFQRKAFRGIPLSLILGYYITLLLGPTVQLRYIYPVMVIFPIAMLFSFCTKYKNSAREQAGENG